jgi:hypothetical protein
VEQVKNSKAGKLKPQKNYEKKHGKADNKFIE